MPLECVADWPAWRPRSESPLETILRLLLLDAGLPMPLVQYELRTDDGYVLARHDLAWIHGSRPIAVEADGGGPHSAPPALYRDRLRQNHVVAADWDVLRFTWADVLRRQAYVVATVRSLLVRRGVLAA